MGLTFAEIARIEEPRQASGCAEIADESLAIAGGQLCYSGQGSSVNQAIAVGLTQSISDAELDELVAFYTDRGAEPKVQVCPFVDRTLLAGLGARGFVARDFENVLWRVVDADEDLRAAHPFGWPEELELEHVDPSDDAAVRRAAELCVAGFFPGSNDEHPDVVDFFERTTRHARCDTFVAHWRGIPAGVGGMEATNEGAGLFGATVLPDFQRKGIQLALILRRMERAREIGSKITCITSGPGIPTERNAVRVGFRLAYSKVNLVRSGEGLVPSP